MCGKAPDVSEFQCRRHTPATAPYPPLTACARNKCKAKHVIRQINPKDPIIHRPLLFALTAISFAFAPAAFVNTITSITPKNDAACPA